MTINFISAVFAGTKYVEITYMVEQVYIPEIKKVNFNVFVMTFWRRGIFVLI